MLNVVCFVEQFGELVSVQCWQHSITSIRLLISTHPLANNTLLYYTFNPSQHNTYVWPNQCLPYCTWHHSTSRGSELARTLCISLRIMHLLWSYIYFPHYVTHFVSWCSLEVSQPLTQYTKEHNNNNNNNTNTHTSAIHVTGHQHYGMTEGERTRIQTCEILGRLMFPERKENVAVFFPSL